MAHEVALMMLGRASSSASSSSSLSHHVSWWLTATASAAKEVSSLALLFLRGESGSGWDAGGWREVGGQISGCPLARMPCQMGQAPKTWLQPESRAATAAQMARAAAEQSRERLTGERSQDLGGLECVPHPHPRATHAHLYKMMGVSRLLSRAYCNETQPRQSRAPRNGVSPHPGFREWGRG